MDRSVVTIGVVFSRRRFSPVTFAYRSLSTIVRLTCGWLSGTAHPSWRETNDR